MKRNVFKVIIQVIWKEINLCGFEGKSSNEKLLGGEGKIFL